MYRTILKNKKLGANIIKVEIGQLEKMSAAHRTVLYEAYQVYKDGLEEMEQGEVKERVTAGGTISLWRDDGCER
ncbi:hypothetical protein MHB50_02410 [Siminovitchia sp. FSL H7-0308]|uniref:Uncharacterized protein n=1 Tax=Siminovitchia thermophila TaxID=1245522 RepID=A0ABS2R2E9_9BACI|nr:hypothetical protein [Siminovitchia thermophila]MBM7713823.1 hypothetical protein [Siminovitchia thermophila]ONK21369.1 hypothetical protein BLX87_22050 [Bacillus sp. VT-16-64]